MAQVDFFLKIDGIQGESQDDKHKNEIHINSWSFGETNSGTFSSGSGGGAGKVKMEDFTFTKAVDSASPKLFQACASGEHIKNAVLTCRKAGKDAHEYLKVTFDNLLVAGFDTFSGSGEDTKAEHVIPYDRIKFNFAHIKVEYKAQKPDGTAGGQTVGEWNLVKNSASAA
jgi:type VI secretion system secreted protein Hcp